MTNRQVNPQTNRPHTPLVGATFRSSGGEGITPPTEVGGSGIGSRTLQCAGLGFSVAVRMAVLYLIAIGKP